ncbi:hypothetical protein E3E26_10425 [Thermococcus sp. LS1]|uniref:hypothetical protein n=1 Tax=Thermococcus sp. LS1 TaxID=1638259 RepID=UPI00143A8D3D|nr:hypothetical protein [Thermococcus sp. LS1]NJE00184.1 hypothetical protein [Thermococcus sp. LS1]
MRIGGAITLFGIALTWLTFRNLERIVMGTRHLSVLLLLGGFLTALGFISGMTVQSGDLIHVISFLVIIGPGIIAYALSTGNLVNPTLRLLLQFGLVLSSLIRVGRHSDITKEIIQIGSLLSVILLMNSLFSLKFIGNDVKTLLKLSSWLIVIFSWMRFGLIDYRGLSRAIIFSVYLTSIVLWVAAAYITYLAVSVIPTTGILDKSDQEGF